MILAEGDGWRWQRLRGRAQIVAVDPSDNWRVARQGLNFDADRLIALAVGSGQEVIITGVGTQAAPTFAGFAALSAPVAPDPGVRRLDSQPVAPGRVVLWAETARGRLVWDARAAVWRAPAAGEKPWRKRLAVRTDGLRVGFERGRAWADAVVTDRSGRNGPVGFSWGRGEQMPFDRVRGQGRGRRDTAGDTVRLAQAGRRFGGFCQ